MHIVNPRIEEYLLSMTPERDPILTKMEKIAAEKSFPSVGPLVGRFLYQIVKMTKAKKIFEMGSGFGYSAYWMAKALPDGGRIICTDSSEEYRKMAIGFFNDGGVADPIEYRVGDAIALLKEEKGPFDIIFNDVDKHQYPLVPGLAYPRLRQGGLLITDNLLWDGKILKEKPDENTTGVLEYTKLVSDDKKFWTTIIPIRDGISISLKL